MINKRESEFSESEKPRQKRAKISYSCLKCREKRTKCDRKSPCSSCKERQSNCVYDTQKQDKPRRPNKDSLIIRLSKQLEFYKDLACKYTPKQSLTVFSEDIEAIDYALGVRTLKKGLLNEPAANGNDISSIATNDAGIDQNGVTMVPLKRTKEEFNENPFSDIYIFKNDDYINNLFFKHVEPKDNDAYPYEATPELKEKAPINENKDCTAIHNPDFDIFEGLLKFHSYHSDFQEKQVANFVLRMYEAKNGLQKSPRKLQYNDIFSNFKFPGVAENTTEDIVENEPSSLLSCIVSHLNDRLPKYSILVRFKKLFLETFYIEYGFFSVEYFENVLKEILVVDGDRVSLHISGSNIHAKLSTVSLLLLILYCSDIQEKTNLKSNIKQSDTVFFNEYPELCSKILMATDLFTQPTELKISILCQLWVTINVTPDNDYSTEVLTGLSTEVLASVIETLSLKIGITSPMGNDSHISNVKLRNYRMQVSESVTFVLLIEALLKGRVKKKPEYHVSSDPEIYRYLDSDDELENNMFHLFQVRNNFLKIIHECMELFVTTNDQINVSILEEKLVILKNYVKKHFNFDNLVDLESESKTYRINCSDCFIDINAALPLNLYTFFGGLFFKGCLLKIYHVLFVSCEVLAFNTENKDANELFMKYINCSYELALESSLITSKYVAGGYKKYVGGQESFFNSFVVLFLCSKLLFIFLQFICKCYVYRMYLQKMIMNEKNFSPRLQVEMHLIEEMNSKTTKVMFQAIKEFSHKFRFRYYQAFKICLFFDFFKKSYKDGTLFNVIFDTKISYNPYSPLPKEVCDNFLMRRFLHCYDYVDYFTSFKNMLNAKDVDEFLKTCSDINYQVPTPTDEFFKVHKALTKSNGNDDASKIETDENFNFEEYLRQLDLKNFSRFSSSFMF